MRASAICFQTGVILVVIGMLWGIQMGISMDHAVLPAHAHLNLLGYVSLFLFGFYYRQHPVLDRSRAALIQVTVWIAGTIILVIGVGLLHTGRQGGEPLAAIGSFVVLAAMLIFGWQLYRAERVVTDARSSMMPAE